jgi:hypothetical protein
MGRCCTSADLDTPITSLFTVPTERMYACISALSSPLLNYVCTWLYKSVTSLSDRATLSVKSELSSASWRWKSTFVLHDELASTYSAFWLASIIDFIKIKWLIVSHLIFKIYYMNVICRNAPWKYGSNCDNMAHDKEEKERQKIVVFVRGRR